MRRVVPLFPTVCREDHAQSGPSPPWVIPQCVTYPCTSVCHIPVYLSVYLPVCTMLGMYLPVCTMLGMYTLLCTTVGIPHVHHGGYPACTPRWVCTTVGMYTGGYVPWWVYSSLYARRCTHGGYTPPVYAPTLPPRVYHGPTLHLGPAHPAAHGGTASSENSLGSRRRNPVGGRE